MTPQPLLGRLYTLGSLDNDDDGFHFEVKNRLFAATLTTVDRLALDGEAVALGDVALVSGITAVPADDLGDGLAFPLTSKLTVRVAGRHLGEGAHRLEVAFRAEPFGALVFEVTDAVVAPTPDRPTVPRDADDDQSHTAVDARRRFLTDQTGVTPQHLYAGSVDPQATRGNIENFIGVAQVPIGLAGPLLVDGEHARGEFTIPLATTEGTLVASYSRGMKAINLAGGVRCSVVDDRMQRAPVFEFDDARQARDFCTWVTEHHAEIAAVAESTTSVGRLIEIESYLASRLAFLRFDFTTGDAAGQNMVGRATFAACSWILERVPSIRRFWLEANFATDKKASQVNIMRTRGKRVTAEITMPRAVLARVLRASPEGLHEHASVANIGSFLSGANNNGLHAANGVAALFIATGQDAANVAESSAAVVHTEVTTDGDFYVSITLPSLIVATHGGGTGLPTQHECLELLGCTGTGSVGKLAEIVAGTVLAGELSLAAAISSLDWVSSHERFGRNR